MGIGTSPYWQPVREIHLVHGVSFPSGPAASLHAEHDSIYSLEVNEAGGVRVRVTAKNHPRLGWSCYVAPSNVRDVQPAPDFDVAEPDAPKQTQTRK